MQNFSSLPFLYQTLAWERRVRVLLGVIACLLKISIKNHAYLSSYSHFASLKTQIFEKPSQK